MAVTEPSGWTTSCRASAVAGAAAWAAGGVAGALGLDEGVAPLHAAGVALALTGWGAEVVVAGLAPAVAAALVALPTLIAGGAVAWAWRADPADPEAAATAGAASMVALAAPFVAAAARSLVVAPASTWHVGLAGAALALGGGVATVATGEVVPGPDAVGLLTVAGVLLVAYAGSDRQSLGELAGSRQARWFGGSVALQLLFAAIAVGSYAVARRNDHTWDWTRTGVFTLSDQTRRVAENLAFDVELVAFYRDASPTLPQFRDLAERVQQVGPRVSVRWVDPLANPLEAKEALVSGDHGVVLLRGNGKERRLEGEIREEELARELLMLGSDKDHVICWVMGHGEPDPDDDQLAEGFGGVRTQLEALNYEFLPVRTAVEPIPAKCELLVLARPATDPLPYEREALAAYVAGGGRALVMVDLYSRQGVLFDVPELVRELPRYGVRVGEDVVFDLNPKHQMLGNDDPTMVVLSDRDLAPHPVTRNLAALVLAGARSVRPEPVEGLEVEPLLQTSPDAWAETTPEAPAPDEGVEPIGEVPLMVVVEVTDPAALRVVRPGAPTEAPESPADPVSPAPGGRPAAPPVAGDLARGVPADFEPKAGGKLVVLGDTDFATNAYLDLANNRDLFLNVVAWLVEEPDQLGARPTTGEPLEITEAGEGALCLVTLGLMPLLPLLVAGGVWFRRRSL